VAALDRILEHLKDGKRHTLEEITKALNLNGETVLEVIQFLADYGFAILDEKRGQTVLDPKIKRLIQEEERPTPELVLIHINGENYAIDREELTKFIKRIGRRASPEILSP